MKNLLGLALIIVLAGCAQVGSYGAGSTSSTVSQQMKACLISEANTRYQAGTLFTNSIKQTASDLVSTCTKKLALQSAGISSETQSMAENIVASLKTMSGN